LKSGTVSELSDTLPSVQAAYDEQLMAMTPAERLQRALALSSFARNLAWAGAERAVGHLGRDAVVARFFLQVYGPSVPAPRMLSRDD
jgi:hypothetical protein